MMLVIRPVKTADLKDIYDLSIKAGKGLTSLPSCEKSLFKKIQLSETSFARATATPGDYYLLVMEDLDKQKVVGTSGIYSKTGTRQAFYAYRLISITHHSHTLQQQIRSDMLHLCNDYTDCAEVGTLFLDPDYRGNGRWLSWSRFLLLGQFKERFSKHVIAEMRGWFDDQGQSPFWEAIGRRFFHMDFSEADHLCGIGSNQFITELMPKHPIYTVLLSEAAQAVIGKPNDEGQAAMKLLLEQGFEYENVVDIFDAGPLLRAKITNIQTVSNLKQAKAVTGNTIQGHPTMIANQNLQSFRLIHQPIQLDDQGHITVSADAMSALNGKSGDTLSYVDHRNSAS